MTDDRTDDRERAVLEATARIGELEATVAAQQAVISTLVTAAEAPGESVTRLGTQHVVERRVARLHQAERVLRSVIESLDGALCIVSEDGTILDANRRWLRMLLPFTHPRDGGGRVGDEGAGDPEREAREEYPGTVGSDFFTWCRTAQGMEGLLADLQPMVREVVEGGPLDAISVDDPALHLVPPERSVKGQIGPEGNRHWVVARVHFVRDHARARAVVTLTDITEGMQTQLQLRRATEEAQRLALVAKATHSAIVITQPDGTVEWVNESFVQRSGFTLDEAVGRQRQDLVGAPRPGDPAAGGLAALLAEIAVSRDGDGEYLLISRGGEQYWASIEVRPVVEDGQVAHLVWVEQDVTARRLAQERLSESMIRAEQLAEALSQEKTLLAGVISAVPQLVFWKDAQGRYVGCNTAYLDFRGLAREEDLVGHDEVSLGITDSLADALRDLEATVTVTGEAIVNRTVDLVDRRGQLKTFLLSVLPHGEDAHGTRGVIGVGADITHARELERQLAQANRLESIGQLAAGIAHEINTPIQYVTGNVHFLTDVTAEILAAARLAAGRPGGGPDGGPDAGPDAGPPGGGLAATDLPDTELPDTELPDLEFLGREIPAALAACDEGLTRVADIVRAMKDYAHPGTGRTDIDVNRALESTVRVCRNEWKYVAQVRLDLAPDAGAAPCFEGELKQVVLNMIVNAAQAIGEDRTRRGVTELGTITVATRREPPFFVITITDDGPGMDEHVRRRAFDPFFTTKDVGKGTGQGLSLAHSVIVTKHGGRIDLQTTPGHGARFDLYLPLTAPRPAPTGDPTDDGRATP